MTKKYLQLLQNCCIINIVACQTPPDKIVY